MKRYTRKELQLLAACFAAYTAAYISRCNLSPSLDAIAGSFGLNIAQVGLLPTCFALPYAAGQIFSGFLADRHPVSRLMTIGLLGSALINMLFSCCRSFPLLIALWFVNGLLQSMIWTPIVRIMAVHFRKEVRDHAAFFMSLTMIAGYLAAWTLSGLLTSFFSWRVAFLVSGLLTGIIAVPSILKLTGIQTGQQAEDQEKPKAPQVPVRHLLLRTNIILLLTSCFANGYVRDSITNWAAKLLMDTQGIDLKSAVGMILIIPTVNFLGIQLSRAAYRKTGGQVFLSSGIMFAVCTVTCLLLGPVSGQSLAGCMVVLVVISAMCYGLNPLLTTLMPMLYLSLNRVALSAGLMDAMIYLGSSFSGSFAGFLADRFGWNAVFISWAVLSLIGTLTIWLAHRTEKRPSE